MDDQLTKPYLTVEELYNSVPKRLSLRILNNKASFGRKIREKELHRPGLALSGFIEVFTYWRVQIIGNTEIGFLNTLQEEERLHAIRTVLGFDLPCLIITNNNSPPKELVDVANKHGITIFSTPLSTTTVIHYLSEFLDAYFATRVIIHGSMVDVYGVGMLITGESAIGKSELALDLVERGHQLVADDVVYITRIGVNRLEGTPSDALMYHMEIRGLGIIDVRSMFGIRAIRGTKVVNIVVTLERSEENREYERIGMDDKTTSILGVDIPLIELPILPGKNITVIAEVIALNHKLKQHGTHAAREFNERLIQAMQKNH